MQWVKFSNPEFSVMESQKVEKLQLFEAVQVSENIKNHIRIQIYSVARTEPANFLWIKGLVCFKKIKVEWSEAVLH